MREITIGKIEDGEFVPNLGSYRFHSPEEATKLLQDGEIVLERTLPKWREWKPPVDYSVTEEWITSNKVFAGRLVDGYLVHAFYMTDSVAERFRKDGLAGYVRAAWGQRTRTVCDRRRGESWRSLIQPLRESILEMENERREGIDGMVNTVCETCYKRVARGDI